VYGAAFWDLAAARPAASAMRLASKRDELRRMLRFERRHMRAFGCFIYKSSH
jgi:hypothetical protein